MSLKIAILASGSGTNAQAIIDKAKAGILDVEIPLVFCNRPGAAVIQRAKDAGLPLKVLDHTTFKSREDYDRALLDTVLASGCDHVVLAGYMRLLSRSFINTLPGRILNIHPALLPSFPGLHGVRDALEYGVKLSGASVHFVEEHMDSGPVIIQAAVPVMADDTEDSLHTRIHALEYRIYPQALQWLAEDRIKMYGRTVILESGQHDAAGQDAGSFVWPPLEKGF